MAIEIEVEKKEEGDKKYEEYEIKEACETLLKAEMIKQDAEFMKVLKPYLEEKHAATKRLIDEAPVNPKEGLDGLKKVAKKKLAENAGVKY